ncbi:triose-phosphate isomerase [Nonlabens ponticola]|uniref:Triosephosphate isomerase n=1 Tax=Nonlabens ponticola TaxID=2496866 RepID=A0A3S9MXI7_9FLAO|nr:triose-phosphate isomerase [Nonlabens ponticola]AZQ43910.1 triose-phosphate isomerase [Nonlabens ponticola]
MRNNILAGNWKMNCDLPGTQSLIAEIQAEGIDNLDCEIMVAPSHLFLYAAFNASLNSPIEVVAQNVSQHHKGAYTGEVSIDMLQSVGIKTVIIGHSERRDIFKENDDQLRGKVSACIKEGMRVIFCCGEHLDERNSGNHFKTVTNQVEKALFQLEDKDWKQIVIAYEPVWAIGTGETASPEQAQEMHAHLRTFIENKYGGKVASNTSILYGGSVKPANAREIFAKPDVDGGLVGGASLDANSFVQIARSF